MQRITLESRGVRLHPALWAAIEQKAKETRLRPTDYLRRRIEDFFSFDPDGHNVPPSGNKMRESETDNELGEVFRDQ